MSFAPPTNAPAVTDQPVEWYFPGKSISEFHASKVQTRVLIGGRGSGKTTAIAVESIGHAFHNAGGKVYILRKTQDSNEDTTLDTFEQVFSQCGTGYRDTGVSLFKKIEGGKTFRLPSRLAIEAFNAWKAKNPDPTKAQILNWFSAEGNRLCSWLCFAGVPSEAHRASRFRGYECSMLIFVEADQLAREDLDLGQACLRWKGSDPSTCDGKGFILDTCVILDSNPPSPRHWIAKLETEAKGDERTDIRFWHVATEENRHNLPKNYVDGLKRQYARQPAMYARMVMGEYAEAFDGTPVFHAFSQEHIYEQLDWPKGAYLIRGWDFGTTNAVIWSAYWSDGIDEYWWALQELTCSGSDVDRQCKAALEVTGTVFPFWNDRDICAGVIDYCDVAGRQKKDTGSSIATLHSYNIFPGASKMPFQDSLTVVNRALTKRDRAGNRLFRIDRAACPRLTVAMLGGYRYPSEGEPGFGGDLPMKGEAGGNFDHVCDALRYSLCACMRIAKEDVEAAKANGGVFGVKSELNRRRRYY